MNSRLVELNKSIFSLRFNGQDKRFSLGERVHDESKRRVDPLDKKVLGA